MLRLSGVVNHCSERVVARAGLARYTMSSDSSEQQLDINAAIVRSGLACVTLTHNDLKGMNVTLDDLEPFFYDIEQRQTLEGEHLKHSSFQRRPLIRTGDQVIVALPTAIGAAVVRYTLECARNANGIEALQWTITQKQVANIWTLGVGGWGILDCKPPPRPRAHPAFLESVGRFDLGGPIHLLYVPDDLAAVAAEGLHTWREIEPAVTDRIERTLTTLSAKPGYRCGLTIVVHGGVGRGFHSESLDGTNDWYILALPIADFMLLGWDEDLSALRAWKILNQEHRVEQRGTMIQNLSGFPNLFAFLRNVGFSIIPEDCEPDLHMLVLPTDSVASLRHFLRNRLDSHAVRAPDADRWLQVQRMTTERNLLEDDPPPIYGSPGHAAISHLAGCVESKRHVRWMTCDVQPDSIVHRNLVYMVWQMALHWLVPITSWLEERLPVFPDRPIVYRLHFPDIDTFSPQVESPDDTGSRPIVRLQERSISLECPPEYLRTFSNETNVGERMMVSAMLRGAHLWTGLSMPSLAEVEATVDAIVGSNDARYFAMTPSRTPEEAIYAAVPLPEPRLHSPEDVAWSRIGLARLAGWEGTAGLVPNPSAESLMGSAVESLWNRIRKKLLALDRRSVIERSLLNAAAVQKDRSEWQRFSKAMLAMSQDEAALRQAGDSREATRALSALASRVVAEMALCTSPTDNGKDCTTRDLDVLLAEVATLLACAAQKDAMYYGLLTTGVMVHRNGSFGFDPSIGEVIYPYISTLRGKQLWDVDNESAGIESPLAEGIAQATFDRAFVAEFGLSVEQYRSFTKDVAERLVDRREPYAWVQRNDVLKMLKRAGAKEPLVSFAAFVLLPRSKWDEENPGSGCKRRDWYPWRYGRRLSVLRRPLVQLALGSEADVLLMPTLLDGAERYLLQARSGRLPDTLFDSEEMRSWIGMVTDMLGHAFNETVAANLRHLGWETRVEVKLTELEGGSELGDIDVLAWRAGVGPVYAVECKRLMYDRTVGEIGRRLRSYTESRVDGERTPMQKHRDRLGFMAKNPGALASITALPVTKMTLRSALVTDDTTPMQLSRHVKAMLDVVVEYRKLGDVFGGDE